MSAEDRGCVDRVLAGKPECFEDLVRRYTQFGGAIAFGILGDFQHAEDVVQEAFFKAFRSLSSLKEHDKFRGWFAGIVRSLSIDAVRKQRTRGRLEVGDEQLDVLTGADSARSSRVHVESPVERQEMQRELGRKLMDCISELPDDYREVVVLKHMCGFSYKEIAQVSGLSVSAIESRLFRARQTLRQKLCRA